jgi:AhpC/TSA family protein
VGGSLPSLVRFFDAHQDRKDDFAILAFHDESAPSFEELDQKLAPIIENRWKGRPLPFPILLDSSGETIETWGIHSFPTTVLIDPEGKIVGESEPDALEEILARR